MQILAPTLKTLFTIISFKDKNEHEKIISDIIVILKIVLEI